MDIIGDRNRCDDQDHGHNDEEFVERKAVAGRVADSWIVWLCLALHVFYLSSVTRLWLSSNSAHGVKPGGRVSLPPPIGWLKVFLAERCAACGCRTGWIGADHTTLVREESALTTNALGDRRGCNRVRSDDSASRSTCVSDVVSALDATRQHGINQVRCRRGGTGARHGTQTSKSAWILSVGRRIGD